MNDLNEMRLTYPRVSAIIHKQNESEFRNISLEILENAAIRGTKVHEYCTSYLLNLFIVDMEDQYKPYSDAFIEWIDQHPIDEVYTGERLYDDERKFSGEFDMIVKFKKSQRMALIDIKTSANVSKAWPIQLAAYKHLCNLNGYTIDDCFNLHLKKTRYEKYQEIDGVKVTLSPSIVKPVLIEQKDINKSWEIFDSALKCYHHFSRESSQEVS